DAGVERPEALPELDDVRGVQPAAQPASGFLAEEGRDPGAPKEVIDQLGVAFQQERELQAIPCEKSYPLFCEPSPLDLDLVRPVGRDQRFLRAEHQHLGLFCPGTAEELTDGLPDLGCAEVILALALVGAVLVARCELRVEIDSLLLLPRRPVELAVDDLGLASRQAQAESLEILPGELAEGEFLGA